MQTTIVRYKLKADRVGENEEFVRAVYAELGEAKPTGFSYSTFKLEDGVSFVHIAHLADGAKPPLSGIKAFQEFQQGVKDRCEELPIVTKATEVGSYHSDLAMQD
jgi:hypothetical protein